jgi:Na+:H+ antiporter, NhaC family
MEGVKIPRRPSLLEAFIPVFVLIALLGFHILLNQGSPHVPLVLGTVVAAMMGLRLGHRWSHVEEGLLSGIQVALKPCLILLVIGMLIGTWIGSGIVPMMIYVGLQVISPDFFLPTAMILCAVVSLATGSSWSTAGTVGVALVGVGQGLGLPLPLIAGAIVSGAYFGDKMSPLSDTTNLAPAVSGSDLFSHIRHMLFSTVPAFCLALFLYLSWGMGIVEEADRTESIRQITEAVDGLFFLHPLLL